MLNKTVIENESCYSVEMSNRKKFTEFTMFAALVIAGGCDGPLFVQHVNERKTSYSLHEFSKNVVKKFFIKENIRLYVYPRHGLI